MCDFNAKDAFFKEKYGAYFGKARSFMEKFHGTYTDEEWDMMANGMSELKAVEKYEVALVVAVLNEIERAYEKGISKTQGDFKTVYFDTFKRSFNFAKLLYFYTQSPTSEVWEAIVKGMTTLNGSSDFERELAVVSFRYFIGVEKYGEAPAQNAA
jgi:hypothetical protein